MFILENTSFFAQINTGIHIEPVPNPECFNMFHLKEEKKEKINLMLPLQWTAHDGI